MKRRTALAWGGVSALGLLSGCDGSPPRQTQESLQCVGKEAMTSIDTLGGQPLVYEINGRPSSFSIEPGFLAQLEIWHQSWTATSGLPAHDQVWTYGAWVDNGACSSWHGAGRAFDISRLRLDGVPLVSCREDLWAELADTAQRDQLRRRYWALAASLHVHFAYVLTYLFDPAHRNHIHVDNSVSGTGMSRFDPRSRVQIQVLQSICTYLWEFPIEPTGDWDAATRRATGAVCEQLGLSGDASRGDNWVALLTAAVGRAA